MEYKIKERNLEWILKRFSRTINADAEGAVTMITHDHLHGLLLEMTLHTLGIEYQRYEYSLNKGNTLYYGYEFELCKLKSTCPDLYRYLNDNLNHVHKLIK